MATKRFKELKNLSKDELATKVRETEAQLFLSRMKLATGQLSDSASLWRMRKDIARLKTLMSGVGGTNTAAQNAVQKAALRAAKTTKTPAKAAVSAGK